jgi:hypothetical protein
MADLGWERVVNGANHELSHKLHFITEQLSHGTSHWKSITEEMNSSSPGLLPGQAVYLMPKHVRIRIQSKLCLPMITIPQSQHGQSKVPMPMHPMIHPIQCPETQDHSLDEN